MGKINAGQKGLLGNKAVKIIAISLAGIMILATVVAALFPFYL